MQGSGRWIGLDLSKRTYEMCYFDQKGKVGRSGGETTKAGRAKLYAKVKPEDSGLGTLISIMLPYSIAFLLSWIGLMIIWYVTGLPLGPGAFLTL